MSLACCITNDRKWLNGCSYPSTELHVITACSHYNNVTKASITLFQDACSPRYLRNIVSKLVEIKITVNYIQVRGKYGIIDLLTKKGLWLQSLKFCTLWDISKMFAGVCRMHEIVFWDVWNTPESQMSINH